ncbi:MAG: hypothetical protein DRQ63_04715 [Gammaproteobacteria bacterium]|nr:MAG: hypothetical protein DRQ63_04715 [Gammaproteobacteria bacterium]
MNVSDVEFKNLLPRYSFLLLFGLVLRVTTHITLPDTTILHFGTGALRPSLDICANTCRLRVDRKL